jgi:ribosome-associated protein
LDTREIAILAAKAASDKKAEEIIVIDVAELLVVVEYFVICTGRNDRQVKTIADEVEDQLRVEAKIKPIGREGTEQGKWVLLDFGDVVVHVFQPEERDFYRLEKLWGEAPRVPLPEEVTGPVTASLNPQPGGSDAAEPSAQTAE